MGTLNLADLQQKADRVIHNADEAVRKWVDLALAPAKDVPIEYYDPNGNLVQKAVPNRAKLFQDLIVNANSVMNRTYYVDQINGNDGNDGSQTAPFQSLQRAINSVPAGGVGNIYIIGTHRLTQPTIIDSNKLIYFHLYTHTHNAKLVFELVDGDTGKIVPYLHISHASLVFKIYENNIAYILSVDPGTAQQPWNTWAGRRSLFLITHGELRFSIEPGTISQIGDIVFADISLDPNILLAYIARSKMYIQVNWAGSDGNLYYGAVKLATDPQILVYFDSFAQFWTNIAISFNNRITHTANYSSYVGGIVRDSSRSVKNVLTTLIL